MEEAGSGAGYNHAHVHRRLAHTGSVARDCTKPVRVGPQPLLQAGFEGELPEVGPCTDSGLHLRRLHVCGQVSDQSFPHSVPVGKAARSAGFNGKASTTGSLPHERPTEGLATQCSSQSQQVPVLVDREATQDLLWWSAPDVLQVGVPTHPLRWDLPSVHRQLHDWWGTHCLDPVVSGQWSPQEVFLQ